MSESARKNWIALIGSRTLEGFRYAGGMTLLLWRTLQFAVRGVLVPSAKFGFRAMVDQMVRVGLKSLGIVMLVQGFIGVILALQLAPTLEQYGQLDKIANVLATGGFRMLGPIITGVVLSGFAGASIAAELGTMVVAEEIEALEAMALNPVRFLVVPRVFATVIMMLLLTIVADLMIALGGWVTARMVLGPAAYVGFIENMRIQLRYTDFFTGLTQAGVFGALISLIACHQGLSVRGGAEGVGRATTLTVVHSIVAIVLAAGVFTAVFYVFNL